MIISHQFRLLGQSDHNRLIRMKYLCINFSWKLLGYSQRSNCPIPIRSDESLCSRQRRRSFALTPVQQRRCRGKKELFFLSWNFQICDVPIADWLQALRRVRFRPPPLASEMNVWSKEECRQFEHGLTLYGKDFHTIHHNKVSGLDFLLMWWKVLHSFLLINFLYSKFSIYLLYFRLDDLEVIL